MRRKLVMTNAYFSYFLIGFVSVIFAPALPEMIKDFGLSLGQASLIFPARSLGTIVAVYVGGAWSDRIGRKPTIVGGAALLGLGSLGVAWGQSWPLVLAAFLLSSIGQGFVNSSVNALVADLNTDRRGAAFNILHGIYGLGGILGPLAAGAFVMSNQGWRPVFLLSGVLWLASTIFTLVLAFPPVYRGEKGERIAVAAAAPRRRAAGGLLFAGLLSVAFLYNSTAWGLIGWINTYLKERADIVPQALAAQMIPLFYIALTTGRFTWSRIAEGLGYGRVILLCALGPVVAFPMVIWGSNPWLVSTGVFVCGLFLSGLFPTSLAYATSRRPDITGAIAGTMSVAMSLGTIVVPWLTGIIASRTSFQTGMTFIYLMVWALLAVSMAVSRVGAAGGPKHEAGAAA